MTTLKFAVTPVRLVAQHLMMLDGTGLIVHLDAPPLVHAVMHRGETAVTVISLHENVDEAQEQLALVVAADEAEGRGMLQ